MKIFRCISLTALWLNTYCIVQSAKILGVFFVPSISHQSVFQPIWRELSLRGHEVTVITTNPLRDSSLTNLTEIDVSFMYNSITELSTDKVVSSLNHWNTLKVIFYLLKELREPFYTHPEIVALINDESKKFDVVLSEYVTSVPTPFSGKYRCPLIGVASATVTAATHRVFGNPVHPLVTPSSLETYGEKKSFLQRVDAVVFSIYYYFLHEFVIMPEADKAAKKYFGNEIPSMKDIEKNVSMVLISTNPVIHRAQPYVPGVIEMGRLHIKPKKSLPMELKSFLDEANEGVIYFSLGSNVQSIHIDKVKRRLIIEAFSELPYKVLWKYENDSLEGKPKNLKISKWLPQQDLLGHPNIKLFITQAGLQSTEEAIVNKVPLIGIPFFADQFYIAERYATLGIGMHLNFATLTKEMLKKSILEVIQNPRYKNKISEIANILTDEPESGLEKAVWWIEYVIRHKGAPYFKSPALNIPWYQYYLLDVICFIAVLIFAVFYILYLLLICTLRISLNKSKIKTT